jgi:long-chain acyl-CoA synthetase
MVLSARSLHEALLGTVSRFGGDGEAVRDAQTVLTRGQLVDCAQRLAGALRSVGVTAGDPVILCAPNGVEFVIGHFAILMAGGVSTPLEAFVSPAVFSHVVNVTQAKAIITTSSALSALHKKQLRLPAQVFVFGAHPSTVAAHDAWKLAQHGPVGEVSQRCGGDLAAILFTSGSTGRPKGVMLSHAATLTALRSIIEFVGYTSDEREVVTVPVAHSFGLGHVYCNLFSGGAVYLEAGLANVKRVLTTISDWGATGFPGTPLSFALLLDTYGPVFSDKAKNLRFIVVNSAPLPSARARQLQKVLPNTELFVYYGLTEASRSTFVSLTREPDRLHTVGRPMPGVQLSFDPETGEVLIAGPHLADGYWSEPVATADAFTSQGLRTGDKGVLDADGFLTITGRLKDQINLGGFKVDPSEVEEYLRTSMRGLTDVGVVGLDDGDSQVVACAVVLEHGATFDPKALTQSARGALEPFKVPTVWQVVSTIPRSATGKILRGELKQLLSSASDRRVE